MEALGIILLFFWIGTAVGGLSMLAVLSDWGKK